MGKNKKNKISTLGSRLTSVISVGLVLVLLGLVAFLAIAGHNGAKKINSNMGFIVKIVPETEQGKIDSLVNLIKEAPYSRETKFISAEQILQEESAYIGEDVLALTGENPYNPEIEVKMSANYAYPDSIEKTVTMVQKMPEVEEVVAQTNLIRTVDTNLNKMSLILLCMAGALLVISIVLINNTVYLSVYSRRFSINTMRLVGATAGFIRTPFVKAGAVTGVIASVLALALLVPLKFYLSGLDPMVSELIPTWEELLVYGLLVILGIGICAFASAIATTKYIRLEYDDMFK